MVLSAPTGSGKSIISAVVSKVFANEFGSDKNSITLMATNSLVDQYSDTFADNTSFHVIKGANVYDCDAMNKLHPMVGEKHNAESCVFSNLAKDQQAQFCYTCEYKIAKSKVNSAENIISNYSYYFISELLSHHIEPRTLRVFDEAHTLSDVFVNHCAIHVTAERLTKYENEVRGSGSLVKRLQDFGKDLTSGKVSDHTYKQKLKELMVLYKDCAAFISISKPAVGENTMLASIVIKKQAKKFADLACKISDFMTYKYDHVFELNADKTECSVKPIIPGSMMHLFLGKYNLFMSGTVSKDYCELVFDLDDKTTAYVDVEPVFEPEHKKVYLVKKAPAMNYTNLNEQSTQLFIKTQLQSVLKNNPTEKGLIFVPSFKLGSDVSKWIPKTTKVFCHSNQNRLKDLIREFKSYDGGSAVLISPSIYEGLNFEGDDSRFQIIVKAPFASLSDKRIKYISTNLPKLYQLNTLMKLVQAIGRSTRSPTDWSKTYVIDYGAIRLFDSPLNHWAKEFYTLYI